nr:unnamed protein product [Callosobruchus chinensis]
MQSREGQFNSSMIRP